MNASTDRFLLFLSLALATYACRVAGYWLMGLVKPTPRVEAALRAAPLAVMVGIVAPAALRGGMAEWAGLAVTIALALWRRNEIVATLIGLAVVAALRALVRLA